MSGSDVAISARGLGKRYQIGGSRAPYRTIRESVTGAALAPLRWLDRRGRRRAAAAADEATTLWALRDIDFEIPRGQAVGIIGRNGAGKSTLLKILSRITDPTTGSVELTGRVGSLLEVGTGFHPELTGRENIYLNGAILGMPRADIRRKFDEIVAFSEVERFLDTPVKRYSSGMYTRLAFAVAAHMDPDVLIVDEVLAVGDAQFQQKCLGKMGDVATKGGRTVLFVSHNMGAVAQLCGRAILLAGGRVKSDGSPDEVIKGYLSEAGGTAGFTARGRKDADLYVARVDTATAEGVASTYFAHNEPIRVAVTCRVNRPVAGAVLGFFVRDQRGRKVFTTRNVELKSRRPAGNGQASPDGPEDLLASTTIPRDFLVPGVYQFTFGISLPHVGTIDWVEEALSVTVIDGGSEFAAYEGGDYGCVFAACQWTLGAAPAAAAAHLEPVPTG